MKKLMAVLAVLALAGFAAQASAHARLLKSDPRAGTTVASPTVLKLWFSEEIVADKSSVAVALAPGKIVPAKIAVDHGNPRLVTVTLPAPLAAGPHKVDWRMMTTDTHTMDGSFTFKVR